MSDLRSRILNAQKKLETVLVTMPESWDSVQFELREPTLRRRYDIAKRLTDKDGIADGAKLTAALLIEMAHDPETHQKVFTEADVESIMDMGATSFGELTPLLTRLAGLDAGASKNGSGASGTTSTASPATSDAPLPTSSTE